MADDTVADEILNELRKIRADLRSLQGTMNLVVHAYQNLVPRVTELESTCLRNHVGTPLPTRSS